MTLPLISRPLAATTLALSSLACSVAARADDDFIVYSPYVTEGQSEVEYRGHQSFDTDPALDGERAYAISVAHAFTSWWHPEIYVGSYEREPGSPNTLDGYEFENIFQLVEQGEYWVDLGFIASYGFKHQPGSANVLEFGPLFEKHSGPIMQRLNLIWEKQVGGGAERKYEFRTTYATTYSLSNALAPGLEAYYRPADDSRQLGPALYGEVASARGNELEYSLALLFGINQAAPDRTLVLRLEYEFN